MKSKICIIVALIVLLIIFLPSFSRMQDMKAQLNSYERQIEQLKNKNKALKNELQKLTDDPVYLEKIARDKMGVVKEGEIIYKFDRMEDNEK